MTTTNLISTPNITGNVGSCTTQAVNVVVNSTITRDTGYTITTNSCTGEVQKFNYDSVNGGAYAGYAVGGLAIFIIIIVFLVQWGNR